MPYVSTKITANTTISTTGGLFYGLLIVAGGTVVATNNVTVYDGTSSSDLQVGEFNVTPLDTNWFRSLEIVCRQGIRVECAGWTDLEVYVLHK